MVKDSGGIADLQFDFDDLFNLRKDETGIYEKFVDYLLSAVVGKQIYKSRKHKSLVSTYTSISDEAFALIVVENNWERWVDMHEQKNFKSSNVMPKFTNAGKTRYSGNGSSNQKFKGWSAAGLKRFNEIFLMVKQDRNMKHAVKWEESFKLKKEQEYVAERINKKRKSNEQQDDLHEIKICHELWDNVDSDTGKVTQNKLVFSNREISTNNENLELTDDAEFMEEDVVVNGSDSSEYDS